MSTLKRMLFLSTLTISTFALPTDAKADRITLKSGRVIEGQVIEQSAEKIVVKTDRGIVASFDLSLVVKIEAQETPRQLYEKELAAAGANPSAEQHRRFAKYCDAQSFRAEAETHWRAVLAASSDDAEARKALGYVRHKDRWLSREEYMSELGLVRFDGQWVSVEEKAILEAAAEAKSSKSRVSSLIRKIAVSKDVEQQKVAQDSLSRVSTENLVKPFRGVLVLGSRAERELVLNEIGNRPVHGPLSQLVARTALADPSRKLRQQAMQVLDRRPHESAPGVFINALRAASPVLRINAASALQRFPDVRAVPTLIATIRMESGDFGRAHFANLTQRAYIQDFELSSGGTGLTVAEVADPVIGGFSEGTVLDIDILKVEWECKVAVLNSLTGQSLGSSQADWQSWWSRAGSDFALVPPAQARRDNWLAQR